MMAVMTQNTAMIILWAVFAAVAGAAVIVVIAWAIRTGQFSRQDRARHLPLWSGIPDDEPSASRDDPSRPKQQG